MDKPRIRADFNDWAMVPMPLSWNAEVTDSDGNQITLAEGMEIGVFEEDCDWYDRDDYLLADGVVTLVEDWCGRGRPMWCVRLDERGVRHESDEPGFELPKMTPAAMRAKMYRAIEQAVSNVGEPDRHSVKLSVGTWLTELRRIDADEGRLPGPWGAHSALE